MRQAWTAALAAAPPLAVPPRRLRRSAFERVLRGLSRTTLWLAGLALLAFAAGLSLFVAGLSRFEAGSGARADAIVVLTGGADRINDGARLLRQGLGDRLLISGLNWRTTPEEIARREPSLKPVLDCCVDFGYQARNTIGNAVEARSWRAARGFRSLAVVTSTYHMPRTLAEFGHAMPGAALLPYPVVSETLDLDRWFENPQTIRLLATEYVKYVVAVARIRLERQAGIGADDRFGAMPPTVALGR